MVEFIIRRSERVLCAISRSSLKKGAIDQVKKQLANQHNLKVEEITIRTSMRLEKNRY